MTGEPRAIPARILQWVTPSATAWRGAGRAVIALVCVLLLFYLFSYFIHDFAWQKLPAFFFQIGMLGAAGLLAWFTIPWFVRIPSLYRLALLVFAPFVLLVFAPGDGRQGAMFTVVTLACISLLGAGFAVFREQGFRPATQQATLVATALGLAGAGIGLYAIFSAKEAANPWLESYVFEDRTLDLPNPGLPGNFGVLRTSYGSGADRHRAEYGADTGIRARTVDASKLIDNWDGFSGWLRSSYWGFDAAALPLQARVWYPDGDGPFPLVLVVHGNHGMEDFSDPGYAYLGELFASRGIILASVDANFLNSSVSAWVNLFEDRPGLKEENDARGWLLLQHLSQWRDWNSEAGHLFAGRVDLERVALIGHSRGGEAVAIAAAFNRLQRYPDDATLAFDFGFNLRGVIAIAPVDGQYKPRDNPTPIRDVNYFTIHGSMDGDVQTFDGTAQYSRVAFSDAGYRFRASLYVDGANHGQFNTTWGNMDTSLFRAWPLDFARIMDGEAQRDVARVYFGAFLEIVLRDRLEYLPIFSDARYAAAWLPPVYYINQFASTDDRVLTDFEEDIDPATMSLAGGRIETRSLSKWYEKKNTLKSARRISQHGTHAAVFAWDDAFSNDTPSVTFVLPEGGIALRPGSVLHLSLSQAGESSLPDDFAADPAEDPADDGNTSAGALDWTVRLTDRNGRFADVPLSFDMPLYPQVNAIPRRARFLDGAELSEALFQRISLPLAAFAGGDDAPDPGTLARLQFRFDRSPRGAIILDDITVTQTR